MVELVVREGGDEGVGIAHAVRDGELAELFETDGFEGEGLERRLVAQKAQQALPVAGEPCTTAGGEHDLKLLGPDLKSPGEPAQQVLEGGLDEVEFIDSVDEE